jgi:hypothetical protein
MHQIFSNYAGSMLGIHKNIFAFSALLTSIDPELSKPSIWDQYLGF